MISLRALVENKILEIQNLATLPSIAIEIMNLTESNKASMKEISRLVERDMTIASKILKVANSPMYGYQRKIDTIQKAVVLLGTKEIYNIVVGISVYSTFINLTHTEGFDRDQFWNHSAGCARLSKVLGEVLRVKLDGSEFLSGLLHDIGKLVLDQYFPKEFSTIVKKMNDEDISFYEAEKELFDIDHSEIGGWLLEKWNIPENVVSAVRNHHKPGEDLAFKDLSSIVSLANEMEKIWGEGFIKKPNSFVLEDSLGWKALSENHNNLEEFDVERFTFELSSELEKAKEIISVNKNG